MSQDWPKERYGDVEAPPRDSDGWVATQFVFDGYGDDELQVGVFPTTAWPEYARHAPWCVASRYDSGGSYRLIAVARTKEAAEEAAEVLAVIRALA
jgi:hypothetical protein